jgi:hypothetical protein
VRYSDRGRGPPLYDGGQDPGKHQNQQQRAAADEIAIPVISGRQFNVLRGCIGDFQRPVPLEHERRFCRLFPLGCAPAEFRLSTQILRLASAPRRDRFLLLQPSNKQGLRLDQVMITSSSGKPRGFINQ